jgi:glutathione S-transferase
VGAGQSRGEREPGALNRRPTAIGRLRDVGERTMSDEFDSLDAREKAALEGALNRCRVLAAKIDDELCNKKSEHFVDKLVLADFCAALERAADALGQRGRQSAPAVKDSQARGRQRHR